MTTLLQQAIELAKSGNRDDAEILIRQSLEENPNNEIAWMWLSGVTRDVLVKREALSRVLQLNPDNELARQGLARFGMPEIEDETPEDIPPTEPTHIDIKIDAPVAGAVEDIDHTATASEPLGKADQEASVFSDMPDDFDFDFDMDEPPVFDVDLDSLEEPFDASISEDDDPFNFDEPPAIVDDGISLSTDSESIANKLEEMFAHSEPDTVDDKATDEAEEETPIILTEPETADLLLNEVNNTDNNIHELLKERQKKQNRMLITATAFFAILVIGSCSLYYYITEKVDYYLLLPQLAGSELTVKARSVNNGISILNFNGFPASSATINWTLDAQAPTCKGTNGLKINFGNGDAPSLYSNNNCKDDKCSFEKNISPNTITRVKVNYLCGKDAVITLHK